jgi:hypothetical protein
MLAVEENGATPSALFATSSKPIRRTYELFLVKKLNEGASNDAPSLI